MAGEEGAWRNGYNARFALRSAKARRLRRREGGRGEEEDHYTLLPARDAADNCAFFGMYLCAAPA